MVEYRHSLKGKKQQYYNKAVINQSIKLNLLRETLNSIIVPINMWCTTKAECQAGTKVY